jgi:hypothetical protein
MEQVLLVEVEKVFNRAELGGGTLSAIGQALGTGFQTALGALQQRSIFTISSWFSKVERQLGQMGSLQQQMAQGDINQLFAAGGLERTFSTASA